MVLERMLVLWSGRMRTILKSNVLQASLLKNRQSLEWMYLTFIMVGISHENSL